MPNNFLGLCTGMRASPESEEPLALTEWLHEAIQSIAGLSETGQPLTFAMLKKDRDVDLELVATNLSHRRPYMFPLREGTFLFDKGEMARLFPKSVVDAMVANSHQSTSHKLPADSPFAFLPPRDQLPVLVATRISLSFPILFGAVPLYTVNPNYYKAQDANPTTPLDKSMLQRNWFSDGGIVCNFPIHLFDAPLPERPTFGINLSDMPPDAFEDASHGQAQDVGIATDQASGRASGRAEDQPREAVIEQIKPEYQTNIQPGRAKAREMRPTGSLSAVSLPSANAWQSLDWRDFDSVSGLLLSAFYTAQSHRDTMQSHLPSYRDRIATVRFAPKEGGFNLAMRPDTIRKIVEKGDEAGRLLAEEFDFDSHRWVRFRIVMALLEEEIQAIAASLQSNPDYLRWLKHPEARYGFPYARSGRWCKPKLVTASLMPAAADGASMR